MTSSLNRPIRSLPGARRLKRDWVVLAACMSLMFCGAPRAVLGGGGNEGFTQAIGPRDWEFPRDHGKHEGYKIEWWYFTGNLLAKDGRRFGYQLTFFRSQLLAKPPGPAKESGPTTEPATTQPSGLGGAGPWATNELYLAHLAVSDVREKRFFFREALSRGREGLAGASDRALDVTLRGWSAKTVDGVIQLRGAADGVELDLECPQTTPVMEGPGGLSVKGKLAGQASYYYSMPRLKTTGSIRIKDQSYEVEGLSWMDHEFSSNLLSAKQQGWDWISLHLVDGRSLMLYRLRNKDGTDFRFGTMISQDGTPNYISSKDIRMVPSEPHASPASGAGYPMLWTIEVPGLPTTQVRAAFPDQELRTDMTTKVTYFEGCMDATDAAGKTIGTGYLEMTGYAQAK